MSYIRTISNFPILVKTPLIFPIQWAPAPFQKRGVRALYCTPQKLPKWFCCVEQNGSHCSRCCTAAHIFSSFQIVPLKALRTDYSLDEDRRSLAKAYDLYLADERIIGMLPGALGKNFYEKKK